MMIQQFPGFIANGIQNRTFFISGETNYTLKCVSQYILRGETQLLSQKIVDLHDKTQTLH